MTLVCEVNEKPDFNEEPTGADIRRYVDILFGSKFVTDESLVDEEKHIYLADLSIKETQWKVRRRNAFLNVLIDKANQLRDKRYKFDIPQCVEDRTACYMNSQYPIYAIFLQLFEERKPDNSHLYKNCKNEVKDEDWIFKDVVDHIRHSSYFCELKPNVKKTYEKVNSIKDFFESFPPLSKLLYKDSKTQKRYIKNW